MKLSTLIPKLSLVLLLGLSFSCSENENESKKEYSRTGNNVTVRLPSNINTLHPFKARTSYDLMVIRHFQPLLASIDLETLELVPILLESLASIEEEDGVFTYSMRLRDEAKWDDGSPVLASDVAFSFKKLINPFSKGYFLAPYVSFIDAIEIDSEDPKRFKISTGTKYILSEEALYTVVSILQESKYEGAETLREYSVNDLKAIDVADENANQALRALSEAWGDEKYASAPEFVNGCGPYELVEWIPQQQLTMVKKPNWWGDDIKEKNTWLQANPDTVDLMMIPDAGTAAQMFKNKEFDVAVLLDSKDFKDFSQDELYTQEYRFASDISNVTYFIIANTKTPLLEDKLVRQAFAHLVDYDAVIEDVFMSYGSRQSTVILPTKDYYDKSLPLYEYNLDKAAELMEQAGWSDSNADGILDKEIDGQLKDFELEYLFTSTPASESIALLMEAAASEIGIKINLIKKDYAGFADKTSRRDFELTMSGTSLSAGYDDLKPLFHTDGNTPRGQNRAQYGRQETNELIDSINSNFDKTSRDLQYKKLQAYLHDELPVIPLMAVKSRVVIHDRFKNGSSSVSPNICIGCLELK